MWLGTLVLNKLIQRFSPNVTSFVNSLEDTIIAKTGEFQIETELIQTSVQLAQQRKESVEKRHFWLFWITLTSILFVLVALPNGIWIYRYMKTKFAQLKQDVAFFRKRNIMQILAGDDLVVEI